MHYKEFLGFLDYVHIYETDDTTRMIDEVGKMTLFYNTLLSKSFDSEISYNELLKRAMDSDYLYKYSSLDGSDTLSEEDEELIRGKLKRKSVTRKNSQELAKMASTYFFILFDAEAKYIGDSNLQFETFILYPAKVKNNYGESFIFLSLTIYENCLLEFNMTARNDIFSLYNDWTVGIENVSIDHYYYKHNAYASHNFNDIYFEDLGRKLQSSFLERILDKKVQKIIDNEDLDFSEYKVFQCDYNIEKKDRNKVKNLINLIHSPLQPNVKNYNFDDKKVKEMHALRHYSNLNSALIFTHEKLENREGLEDKRMEFYGLYAGYAVSLKPVLVDRHANTKVINYYKHKRSLDRKSFLDFNEYLHELRMLKMAYINPVYKSVLTLTTELEDAINPQRERELVEDQLNSIYEYYQLNLSQKEFLSNDRIQKLLLFLSLITAISIIIDLPINNSLKILVSLILSVALIVYLKW